MPWVQVADARLALAALAARLLRPPERGADADRHHRHERQDDDVVPAGLDLRGGRASAAGASARSATGSAIARSRRLARRPRRRSSSGCCARWSTDGCGACVMEVSSHALALRRADRLRFAAAHLHEPDPRSPRLPRRHGAVLRSRSAGCSSCCRTARVGDRQSRRSARRASSPPRRRRPVTYAIDAAADVRPRPAVVLARRACRSRSRTPRGTPARPLAAGRPSQRLQHSRRGRRRRWRSTCRSARSKRASPALADVPGRFQVVSDRADDVRVVVDYAHTDDALKNLLETARPLATGRVDHRVRLRRRSRSRRSVR